ncbi:MAG: 5-demethoxyubiquinol-8 5-hydroxylase UbiM [Janthinobacterium lividum]
MGSAQFDIVVAGAGPVGLAFAASVAGIGATSGTGTGLRVALVDPQPAASLADPADDGREIALTDRSVNILTALGAWSRIPADAIAPLRRMQVLNGPSHYAMHLGTGETLGRFAPNHCLRRALYEVVRDLPDVTILAGRSVTGLRIHRDRADATLSDGEILTAPLVIAADTRRSALRQSQGIGVTLHDYKQRMLVCPMAHPIPHRETATAWFDYGQTLNTLPLNGGRSSAVMTLPEPDAAAMLALDDAAFGREVTRRYQNRLGAMVPVGKRHAVPVVTTYAHRFVARRFALMGDAAVGMHPTTAHGFNFGLLGQQALAREIRTAHATGRDLADPATLSRYEAAHRSETRLFFTGTEAIMQLYAAGNSLPARMLRNGALRLGNLPPFRSILAARMRDPDAARNPR